MDEGAGPENDLSAPAVQDIMTVDPVMLCETDTLAVAPHKMSIGGFRHIPFVAEGRPTLVVSAQDVFHYVSRFIHSNQARSKTPAPMASVYNRIGSPRSSTDRAAAF